MRLPNQGVTLLFLQRDDPPSRESFPAHCMLQRKLPLRACSIQYDDTRMPLHIQNGRNFQEVSVSWCGSCRKLPGLQRAPKVAPGAAAASSRLAQGSARSGSTAATSAPRTSAANAGGDVRRGNGAGRIPGPPRRGASATGNAAVGSVHARVPDQPPRQQARGSAPGRVPDQAPARLGPGPLAAGRAHASAGAQVHFQTSSALYALQPSTACTGPRGTYIPELQCHECPPTSPKSVSLAAGAEGAK